MNAAARLQAALRRARIRSAAQTLALGLPLILVASAVLHRLAGLVPALAVAALGLVATGAIAYRRARRHDPAWLARALDAGRADMDDSAALLFADAHTLSPLQALQRSRLAARIDRDPAMPAPPPWRWRLLWLVWGAGLLVVALALVWTPRTMSADEPRSAALTPARAAGAPALQAQQLRIEPPAYTGLPARVQDTLDGQAPEGAQLTWTLRFAPQPATVTLEGLDDSRIGFRRQGEDWVARTALARSMLYRIAVDGDPDGAVARAQPWRIDAVPDRPPVVRVREPDTTLATMTPGQRAWRLVFEAEDDYGVAVDARLRITVTHGAGENITFEDHTRRLRGSGDARLRRFEVTLDPLALGLQEGGDLVAQLRVQDNRAPQPQRADSPSLILRWLPPVPPDADGLEGLARDVLPAYFRSQRQIIIDAEALIARRAALAADDFAGRSDGIGVDQRLLRLRYGQFLGEESEGAPRRPLPVADDEPPPPPRKPLPIDDFGQQDLPVADADHADQAGHDADDPAHDHDHDHADPPPDAMTFGRAEDVLETFGHTHDLPGAATLLDPKTREILRGALREMWQSELHLRQAEPQRALAPANRALELIKQVQQADRIYLARVGSVLPAVDFQRRLGGDRDGIAPRAVPGPGDATTPAPELAWRALTWDGEVDLDALAQWLRAHPAQVDDPLSLLAALDGARRDPACASCRQALRAQLWRVLQRPPTTPPPRPALDAMGARYLDTLGAGDRP